MSGCSAQHTARNRHREWQAWLHPLRTPCCSAANRKLGKGAATASCIVAPTCRPPAAARPPIGQAAVTDCPPLGRQDSTLAQADRWAERQLLTRCSASASLLVQVASCVVQAEAPRWISFSSALSPVFSLFSCETKEG